MKKTLILTIIFLSFILVSCWNNVQIKNENDIQNIQKDAKKWSEENVQNTTKHTRADCMKWCEMLWKWSKVTEEEKKKNCNGLCDFQQWIQENDTSYCEKATWSYKDMCYSTIAKNTKDVSLCEKIGVKIFLYSCYQTVAEETKDASLCEKISDVTYKEICLEKFQK